MSQLAPELAFKLRTLLVAEFRRIALSDPQLPAPLLPPDWIGNRARRLAAGIYASVAVSSEDFLTATADPELGAAATIADRFAHTTQAS
jgi:phenylacetic acid degradation operon negative regulatory protein